MQHQEVLLILSALLSGLLYLSATTLFAKYKGRQKKRAASLSTGSPADESDSEVALEDPTPVLDFDLSTAKTRDYLIVNKSLRWPYFQTMAHQPMQINDWIEVDKDYEWYIKEKLRVVEEEGSRAVDSLPENDEAAGELLDLVVDYLPKRFPTLFEAISDGIVNKVTGVTYKGCGLLQGVEALKVVAGLTQCDFLMAKERDDGHVYFTGGLVAFPGFYLLSEKIGKSMAEVHAPVPEFNEKLLLSVERTLKRFKAHEPFERASWEIVDDWSLFRHNLVDLPEDAKLRSDLHPKDYLFRIDRQTFRKLPKSRGIIFGVHPILKKLEDMKDDPLVPRLLAHVHEKGAKNLMDYKLAPMYQDRMMPYLAELTQSQIERGLITGDEDLKDFRELARPASQSSS